VHCGELVSRDAHSCPKCASKSPFGYHCPACLKPIERDNKVCSSCGKELMTVCPYCKQATFAGTDKCDGCKKSLMIKCPNKKCNEWQFFENEKCTVCGKAIKNGKKELK
jgi:predicted nucleic acid-binding Zn ribbon protein